MLLVFRQPLLPNNTAGEYSTTVLFIGCSCCLNYVSFPTTGLEPAPSDPEVSVVCATGGAILRWLRSPCTAKVIGRGTNDNSLFRRSATELRGFPRQESDLRPPAYHAKELLPTPPAKLS